MIFLNSPTDCQPTGTSESRLSLGVSNINFSPDEAGRLVTALGPKFNEGLISPAYQEMLRYEAGEWTTIKPTGVYQIVVSNLEPPLERTTAIAPSRMPVRFVEERAATAFLTPTLRSYIQTLRAIILSAAAQSRFPLTKLTVGAFTDPEEGWSKVICRAAVEAMPEQAIAFWDYLGGLIDAWRACLSAEAAATVAQRFAIYVEWV